MKKNRNLGVEWYLPHRKRPFAYSTKATSDLIKVLYEDVGSVEGVLKLINYDEDAKAILREYLKHGIHKLDLV